MGLLDTFTQLDDRMEEGAYQHPILASVGFGTSSGFMVGVIVAISAPVPRLSVAAVLSGVMAGVLLGSGFYRLARPAQSNPLADVRPARRRAVMFACFTGEQVSDAEDAERAVRYSRWLRTRYVERWDRTLAALVLAVVLFVVVPTASALRAGEPPRLVALGAFPIGLIGYWWWWLRLRLPERLDRAEEKNAALLKQRDEGGAADGLRHEGEADRPIR